MSNLKYQLLGLEMRNKDGSHSTQAARRNVLIQVSKQLKEGGYKLPSIDSLKPKHVEYLVNTWKEQELSTATIKNRMSHVRWWADKVGKSSMLPKTNDGANHAIRLDIEKRSYVPTVNKAKELDLDKLALIKDERIVLALRLQSAFGLRREEAIKFIPSYSDRGNKMVHKVLGNITLLSSTTKGGKEREVPVQTAEQRDLLNEVRRVAGGGSLIPHDKKYIQQLKKYERETAKAGLDKNHGLRHMYIQRRYFELTGWKAPLAGGPSSKDLTPEQKIIDNEARLIISHDVGHEREQITVTYLGR